MPDLKLAIIVRAHARERLLAATLRSIGRFAPQGNVSTRIFIAGDRISADAAVAIGGFLDVDDRSTFKAFNCPILSLDGERFLDAQNMHLDWVERDWDPDWIFVMDDDFTLDVDGWNRLPDQLARDDVDAFYMSCLFLEDSFRTHNAARKHRSIRLYRHQRGARFSGKRMLSIPDALEARAVISFRTADYPGVILEHGGFDAPARIAVQQAYLQAGKDDQFVRALTSRRLVSVPGDILNPFETLLQCPSDPTHSASSTSETSPSGPTPSPTGLPPPSSPSKS